MATLLAFGFDFLFNGKFFLPMDYLHYWRPWSGLFPPSSPLNNIVISDVAEGLYPLLHFLSDNLKAGHIPLWNPYLFLGLPTAMFAISNYAFNPLYGPLLYLLAPETAHSVALLVNLSAIAAFSYLFFIERGMTRTASLLGSMIFTFNGHLMVMLEYAQPDFAYAGTAIALYLFEKSLNSPRWRWILLNGLTLGSLFLGGSIQWVFFLIPLIGLYAAARTIEGWNTTASFGHRVRPLIAYAIPVAIGVLIGAPTLLYFGDYVGLTQRTIRSFEWVTSHTATFHPEMFTTFVFPNFFGYQPSGVYFARDSSRLVFQNYAELAVYMGAVTVPLVALAYRTTVAHRKMVIFWGLIAAGALLVAMKPPGLYYLLYRFVPGFNGMQPTRTIILLPPAFAYLAAASLHGLQRQPPTRRQAMTIGVTIAAGVVAAVVALAVAPAVLAGRPPIGNVSLAKHFRLQNGDFFWPLSLLALVAGSFLLLAVERIRVSTLGAILVALLIVDLVPFGLKWNTRVDREMIYPVTPGLQYLMQDPEVYRTFQIGFRYNSFLPYHIPVFGGYATMYPASYLALASAMETKATGGRVLAERNQNYVEPMGYTSKLLPMLNVKYLVVPADSRLPDEQASRYEMKHRSDLTVYETKSYLPRAFVAYDYVTAARQTDAIATMLAPEFDPLRTVVVQPTPGVRLPEPDPTILRVDAPLSVSRPNTDQIDIEVSLVKPGILVVSEQEFPGWEVTVDEAPAQIFGVNAILMGTSLSPGPHRVTFRFAPKSVRLGIRLALGAVAVVVAFLAADMLGSRRAKRRRHTTPSP
ncbi:MAG: hypothetical protein HY207_08090 [Nitrospirae bacterium]|nr:hypothetical protein [Nitrospirota bacterium]